jgi:uncharacterized protein (DUF362 family)
MKHKVLIMRCEEYDPQRISAIVKQGMDECGVRPTGRTYLKPNCVTAHSELFPHAFTRPEFLEGVIMAVKAKGADISELGVAERCGITLPTRWAFKEAGYNPVLARHDVKAIHLEESRPVRIELRAKERLRDEIFVPEPIAKCDFLINLPKFKAHPWTRLTLGLKNYIGIQDDRHRLIDHNQFLEHKIADLQEVVRPGFIAIDAITAGQKMMLTPTPFPMGAIIMGTNPCAVDTVGCHMVNVDPRDVVHLRLASERGLGPIDLADIEVGGDFPLEEVQAKTKGFEFCLERIDSYFGDGDNLRCTVGTFPEAHSSDYCWGGCPGALQEAIHIFKVHYPNVLGQMRKVRYVVGKVEGPLNLDPDERVLFAGDCTEWHGEIDGQRVDINPKYRARHEVSPHSAPSNDMILKILGSAWDCFVNRSSRYLHAQGCPASVAAHVNYLSSLGKINNINFDPKNVVPVNLAYWKMRGGRFMSRFRRP